MGGALLTTRGSIDLRFIKVIYSPKQAEVQQTIEKGPPVSDAWGCLSEGRHVLASLGISKYRSQISDLQFEI